MADPSDEHEVDSQQAPDPRPALDPQRAVDPEHAVDPALPGRIRAALAGAGSGVAAYLDLGAMLDRASDLEGGREAAAWRSLHASWDRPWIIAIGRDGAEVARCVVALVERTGTPQGLTVARESYARLPHPLRSVEHTEWDWWFTTEPPAARPGESRVVALDPRDPRIDALLDVASPDPMVRPGDRRVVGWSGIEAPDDQAEGAHGVFPHAPTERLVAVGATMTMRPGVPHLASVATHPQWRGRGLARDLCAAMTRSALAGDAPAVTLGTYAANRTAGAVYASLGYRVGCRWSSAWL